MGANGGTGNRTTFGAAALTSTTVSVGSTPVVAAFASPDPSLDMRVVG